MKKTFVVLASAIEKHLDRGDPILSLLLKSSKHQLTFKVHMLNDQGRVRMLQLIVQTARKLEVQHSMLPNTHHS